MSVNPSVTFFGGVGSVTGANFILEAAGKKVMVDCGMTQGSRFADDKNREPFPYSPAAVDFLLVTHAHIDHIGRIPKLVREGFRGRILSTPETHALAGLMFEDALKLMEEENRNFGSPPLYERGDIDKTLSLWGDLPYHERRSLSDGLSVYPKYAGHILGSAMFEITLAADRLGTNAEPRGQIKILFTGDLGNSPTPILRDTESIAGTDYLVMESVYGDRNHEDRQSRRLHLGEAVVETAKRQGTLVIPTFSIEKTQVLLYEFHKLEEERRIPVLPVFLDSPLAIEVTKVYQSMRKSFNDSAFAEEAAEGDIFRFPRLKFTPHSQDSKNILNVPPPKIILAGSGMSNGGRVLHHEVNYLPGSQNTLLFVGFQAAGTLGRQIEDGAKEVMINGQKVPVRAHIKTISGYSSHKDSDHLIEFVAAAPTLKKVFVVMGEPKAALFLVQRLRDYAGLNALHPEEGERVELS